MDFLFNLTAPKILFILIVLIILAMIGERIAYAIAIIPAIFAGSRECANIDTTGDIVKDLKHAKRSKSEAIAVKIMEELIDCPMPTVNPAWLVWRGKTLELDGYCAKRGIALEFSGPLHTKWYPQKESYIKYYERVARDIVKRKMCKKKGVYLIVIDMTLPRSAWRDYMQSRLHDNFPNEYDKPSNYLVAQKAKPFRNEQLEREMGLEAINIAKKL